MKELLFPDAAPLDDAANNGFPHCGSEALQLVGAACGHGGRDKRSAAGPEALKVSGLADFLQARGMKPNWLEILEPDLRKPETSSLQIVSELDGVLAERISGLVSKRFCFAVLGGDHACAIGTWSGVYRALGDVQRFGLIWVDAHMDSHTPETTPSGAIHGMPLACLLGYGAPELTSLVRPGPALLPQHVCLIGVRSYEREEAALLSGLGVRVFHMDEVNRLGLDAVMQEALGIVRAGTAGFGVSIDLDAIDPQDAPAVASKVPGGLPACDLIAVLKSISAKPGLIGLEIAEFNPFLDLNDQTLHLIPELLAAAMAGGSQA